VSRSPIDRTNQRRSGMITVSDCAVTLCVRRLVCPVFLTSNACDSQRRCVSAPAWMRDQPESLAECDTVVTNSFGAGRSGSAQSPNDQSGWPGHILQPLAAG
jgi:hypothetical protein